MMNKRLVSALLLWTCCSLFVGCVQKPARSVHTAPTSSHVAPIVSKKSAVEVDPQLLHWSLYWRCTVGNDTNTWHSDAATLIDAQMKAKQLCELLSNGRGICRYKGCVQVESE